MKLRNVLAAGAICGFASVVNAQPYGQAGCGLGSMVIKDDGIIQVIAATTNGTSGSQTFGITSGTSNCVKPSKMAKLKNQEDFFFDNYASLAKEAARGEGDSLKALSFHLGCSEQAFGSFTQALKQNHAEIFAAPGAVASLDVAKKTLKADSTTATQCADLT